MNSRARILFALGWILRNGNNYVDLVDPRDNDVLAYLYQYSYDGEPEWRFSRVGDSRLGTFNEMVNELAKEWPSQ